MYNTILRTQFLHNPICTKQMWNLLNIFRDETQTFQEIKLRSLNKFYRNNVTSLQKTWSRDFPGGPVVKTPCSQIRGPGFDCWSGN